MCPSYLPSLVSNFVDQRPNAFDIYPDITSVLQDNSRLSEEANSSRRTGQEYRTSFERCALREISYLLSDVEDHIAA